MLTPMITIDVRALHNSGIGTYIQNLLPRLIAAKPELTFHLLGSRDDLSVFTWAAAPNVTTSDCTSPLYSVKEQLELAQKTPRDTDLFWSPHYNIPIFHRGKLLVTVHDVFHLAQPEMSLPKKLYAKGMFRAVRQKADAIVTVSEFSKGELVRFTGRGKQAVTPIHIGVDEAWFDVPDGPRPYEKPYILFVGSVKPHKNVGGLIRALELAQHRIPHDLVIVGRREGLLTADEEVAAKAAALGERVHFTGLVEDAHLKRFVKHADALVLPSFYEGFGLPPLEAMACGCPALVSNAASLPEACGDAALYCDPRTAQDIADKLVLLMEDEALRTSLRQKGLERAGRFTWEACAQKTLAVLERTLSV